MLTQSDIDFMRETRREVVAGRERPITLSYRVEPERDPWTGEPIPGTDVDNRDVQSVVTELSSHTQADRIIVGGVESQKGDIWFSVDIDVAGDIFGEVVAVRHDSRDYTVIAQDKKGIGERNRVEFLGRRTS